MKAEEDYVYFIHPKIKKYEMNSLQTENLGNLKNNTIKKNHYITNYTSFPDSTKNKITIKANNKIIKNNTKKKSVKLPLLINKNNISSFEKMKRYKVIIPEKKLRKNSIKSIDESTEEKKKETYMDYFINKSIKRKKKLNKYLDEINKTEDRYNKEIPDLDSDLTSKDKNLVENKWKNSFYLDEYQQFFMRNLKGKISSMNYRQMTQKFREITSMCFSPGNEHFIPKKLELIDYI